MGDTANTASESTGRSWGAYGLNAYEALANGIAGAIVLPLRSKRMPNLEQMLKFGLEKAIINVVSSILGSYITPSISGVNELDIEYLSSAVAAALSSSWKPGYSAMYLAQEQMMVSLISHLITTKTASHGVPYINTNLGNTGIETINPNSGLY